MLIETLTPPLMKAPLHSHRSHCFGVFHHSTVFHQCCIRHWYFWWWLIVSVFDGLVEGYWKKHVILTSPFSLVISPMKAYVTNFTKITHLSFDRNNISHKYNFKGHTLSCYCNIKTFGFYIFQTELKLQCYKLFNFSFTGFTGLTTEVSLVSFGVSLKWGANHNAELALLSC